METILIVDDEKNYPLILSAVLEEEGYETLTANSAREALEILSGAEVDLIITDMKMPGMQMPRQLLKTRRSPSLTPRRKLPHASPLPPVPPTHRCHRRQSRR